MSEIYDTPPTLNTGFTIGGQDFDTDACTRAIGIEPSQVWRQTRADLIDDPRLANVQWTIELRGRELFSTDDAVREVINIVWPKRREIAAFVEANNLECSVTCNITIHGDQPVYEVSVETMSRLVELNADLGFDIFDFSECDDEAEDQAPSQPESGG